MCVRQPELNRWNAGEFRSKIFLSDRKTAVDFLPGEGEPESIEALELADGGFVEVSIGDYAEV